jgi:Ca-activated chloride channel family protein
MTAKNTRDAKDRLRLSIRSSRPAMGRLGGGVHLLVRAEPPAPPARAVRRPVALALVIDRSGSMGGPASTGGRAGAPGLAPAGHDTGVADKLSFVRAATLRLLELVRDGDAVSLITFDDSVGVIKPLTVLGDHSRRSLAAAVRGLRPGGSTFLEGGFRAALDQLSQPARERYGCKVVLLSDGEANVGERRPAVLAEVAAGAAHGGVTTSTLGVGFDYNIALLASLAEAGNGDFSHIQALESLDDILRAEFTTAAEVTARAVEVSLELPERLACGTNLNSYRQESTETGSKVLLGDLVRPKEFLVELTSPVPLQGDRLPILARATYRDVQDSPRESEAQVVLRLSDADEALREPADEEVVEKVLIQLPAQAEMAAVLAYEAGDRSRARAAMDASRAALAMVRDRYGPQVVASPHVAHWEARLSDLTGAAEAGVLQASHLKGMFAASYDRSRSRLR